MKSDVDKITISMESVRENLNKTEFDDSEKELVMSAVEEVNSVLEYLRELKAYRATGYTPEQITELHDKHWDECRQIAHYDNDLNSNRGWIPCSERMPDLGVAVHVYAKRDDARYQFDAFVAYSGSKWFTYDSTKVESLKSNAVDSSYEITHWMPLPEPPSVEEETEWESL